MLEKISRRKLYSNHNTNTKTYASRNEQHEYESSTFINNDQPRSVHSFGHQKLVFVPLID